MSKLILGPYHAWKLKFFSWWILYHTMHIRRITRVYPWANWEIQYHSWVPSIKMGLAYWKVDNIYLLVSQFVDVIKNMICMSKHIFWRSSNSMDTFSKLYLWWPSWTFWLAEWISSCLLLIVQYQSTDMTLYIRHYIYIIEQYSWIITLIQIDILCSISLNNIQQKYQQQESLWQHCTLILRITTL